MKLDKALKGKILTKDQTDTLKGMIIDSMRGVYVNSGALPPNDFDTATGFIADKIISNTQKALIQNTVFAEAVKESKPLKKVKKNVRK